MTAADSKPGPDPAIFVVHSLDHAVAAAEAAAAAGRPVLLRSAPGAAGYAGIGWFLALIGQTRERVPQAEITAALDCGGDLALIYEAIHAGAECIRVSRWTGSGKKVENIAAANGVAIDSAPGPVLDLRIGGNPAAAARKFLA